MVLAGCVALGSWEGSLKTCLWGVAQRNAGRAWGAGQCGGWQWDGGANEG